MVWAPKLKNRHLEAPGFATEVPRKSLIIVKILKSHFQEGFIYVKQSIYFVQKIQSMDSLFFFGVSCKLHDHRNTT